MFVATSLTSFHQRLLSFISLLESNPGAKSVGAVCDRPQLEGLCRSHWQQRCTLCGKPCTEALHQAVLEGRTPPCQGSREWHWIHTVWQALGPGVRCCQGLWLQERHAQKYGPSNFRPCIHSVERWFTYVQKSRSILETNLVGSILGCARSAKP